MSSLISMSNILKFFGDTFMKEFERGENSYSSQSVREIRHDRQGGIILNKVQDSMETVLYNVMILLTSVGKLEKAECECPKGNTRCSHMGVTLFYAHYNFSITDRKCKWSARTSFIEKTVAPLEEILAVATKNYLPVESCPEDFDAELTQKLTGLDDIIGLSWLLGPEPQFSECEDRVDVGSVILSNKYLMADNKEEFLRGHLRVDNENIQKIERLTVGQFKNARWLIERKFRLTASHFGIVLAAIKKRSFKPSLLKSLNSEYNLDE